MNLRTLYQRHQQFWNRQALISLLLGLAVFAVALYIQASADRYVGRIQGIAVPDLILNHFPALDLDFFIVQGALFLTFIIIGLLAYKPRYIIFSLKAISVFIIVRSISITLTHLGVDPHELQLDTDSVGFGLYNILYNTKNDFFFSGHTGLPFLMAMIFWEEVYWRWTFLIISAIFGASVLLAHIHYSIDVFGAPFMTYSIFVIARNLFKKDFQYLPVK